MGKEYPEATKNSRHYQLAQKRLLTAEALLVANGFHTKHDNYPFHFGVFKDNKPLVSIHHGGWDFKDFYEVQRLLGSGEIDSSYEEEGLETPEEVLGYVSKQLGGER